MKSQIDRRLLIAGFGLAGAAAMTRLAKAGPLVPPPGPIASTGQSMAELSNKVARTAQGCAQPRTPISSCPTSPDAQFVISTSGSYCMTEDLYQQAGMCCIDIQCDDVDIDCDGFVFHGSASGVTSSCIRASGRRCIEVHEACFSGWQGCACDMASCDSCCVTDCSFRSCFCPSDPATGTLGAVCRLGRGCEFCDCDVLDCVGSLVHVDDDCDITDCSCVGGSGGGYLCANGCCCMDCRVSNNAGVAFQCGQRCVIDDNHVIECGGIACGAECVICNNDLTSCDAAGGGGGGSGGIIYMYGGQCCCEENYVSARTGTLVIGIACTAGANECVINGNQVIGTISGVTIEQGVTGCCVVGCVCRCQPGFTAYSIAQGNSFGPIADVAGIGDMSLNAASRHPWANFAH